jgi:N-acetylmuramoyl-L-alanine amidase
MGALAYASLGAAARPKLRTTSVSGRRYYYLEDVATRYGLTCRRSGQALLLSGRRNLRLELERREATLDGIDVNLSYSPVLAKSVPLVSDMDLCYMIDPLLNLNAIPRSNPFRIMIDPGHGGKDPGCLTPDGRGHEADIVLAVAKMLAINLKVLKFDARLTRTTDRFIELDDRPLLAKQWNADLFVCLHVNTVGTPSIRGVESHILPPLNAPPTNTFKPMTNRCSGHAFPCQNIGLAYEVQKGVMGSTRSPCRGIRHSDFAVLRGAPCPATLLELGFFSNSADRKNLLSPAYHKLLAAGIVAGIRRYQQRCQGLA